MWYAYLAKKDAVDCFLFRGGIMKRKYRFLLFALCAMLAVSCFSGCARGQKPLRICIDIGGRWDCSSGSSGVEREAEKLMQWIDNNAGELGFSSEQVELEIVPGDESQETERTTALQRIRTEIMAGKGPDVFLCATEGSDLNEVAGGRLFPYVEKTIDENRFLPLDSDTISDLADYPANLLNGGKNEDGELVILPLRFTIPMVLYNSNEVANEDIDLFSIEDTLHGENHFAKEQISWLWSIETFLPESNRKALHTSGLLCFYENPIDFDAGCLRMDDTDLTELLWNGLATQKELLESTTEYQVWALSPFDLLYENETVADTSATDFTMQPICNENNTATAVVTLYGAINRNTAQRENALKILNFLASTECSEQTGLLRFGEHSMPANAKLCTTKLTGFTENTLAEWQKACEEIGVVHYPSPVDSTINQMVTEIGVTVRGSNSELRAEEFALGTISKDELAEIVESYYKTILRQLDES